MKTTLAIFGNSAGMASEAPLAHIKVGAEVIRVDRLGKSLPVLLSHQVRENPVGDALQCVC